MIRILRACVCLAIALPAGACTVVTGDGVRLRAGSDAFADYVESVFREQNEVLSALSFALDAESLDSDRYIALEAAEADVLEHCDGLNVIATARQRGERSGGLGALAAARRAPDCERAAQSARDLLGPDGQT